MDDVSKDQYSINMIDGRSIWIGEGEYFRLKHILDKTNYRFLEITSLSSAKWDIQLATITSIDHSTREQRAFNRRMNAMNQAEDKEDNPFD